uniref:Uncharacterized protein n=1 Tax=Anguilla anguilla TaxID=7936 RepID=A0A0E9RNF3_ANGAN
MSCIRTSGRQQCVKMEDLATVRLGSFCILFKYAVPQAGISMR